MTPPLIVSSAPPNRKVNTAQVAETVAEACPADFYRNKRILLIVPDGTRTAPVGLMFKTLHAQIGGVTKAFDILVALGTHQPMTEEAICQRLEISLEERRSRYGKVVFHNHAWDNPAALKQVGTLTPADVSTLTDGLFSMEVPVEVNKLVFEYDRSSSSARYSRTKSSGSAAATSISSPAWAVRRS
jgi:lactate racemase